MPQPGEVGDAADALAAVYTAGQVALDHAVADLAAELAGSARRGVLRRRVAAFERILAGLDYDAREWVAVRLPPIYELGAREVVHALGGRFDWSRPHRAALLELERVTYRLLGDVTLTMRDRAAQAVRDLGRRTARTVVLDGVPAQRAGERFTRELIDRGVTGVIYRNGARVPLDAYAEMVARTRSAVVYNAGTLNAGHLAGVQWWEVFDGADCGWARHDDGDQANGTVRTEAECRAVPISHPNCRRSFGPRPDLREAPTGRRSPSTTAAQRADQAAHEAFLREAKRQRRSRINERARAARTPRAPRTPR